MAAGFPGERSLNARVGAVALAVSAFMTLLLSHVSASLAPLRLLAVAGFAFAAWCFCDVSPNFHVLVMAISCAKP